MDTVKALDAAEGNVADALYERTIDYGAHPNERALMQSLKMDKGKDNAHFQVVYLAGNTSKLSLALRTCAQIGVCSLGIFRLVYKDRFDLVGLSHSLDNLRQGL